MDIREFFKKLINGKGLMGKGIKDPKKLMMNMIIILLCGVLIILIGDISGNMTSKKDTSKQNSIEVSTNIDKEVIANNYEENMKRELVDTLSAIEGVGKLSAMIYFEGGSQTIPAFNINNVDKKTEESDNAGGKRVTTENDKNQNIVLINEGGESKPFIVKQNNPSIGGVVIVAEGASNAIIRERLLSAVKTALNLPYNKVSIMPMKKSYLK